MDAVAFEQVYGAFGDFHAYFAPLFGHRETRDHSRHYLQALLVQSGERRNAENLSEAVPASARVMQRFLAESPWDDDTVIGRLQEYLGPRLGHPEGVWVLDCSDFSKQGRKSVGAARQYCGRLGKVANCQAGMFLAYVSPLGRALVDKRLYLPESWTSDKDRCAAAGVPEERQGLPEERQGYRSKTKLALEMLERGHLRAGWVAGDDAFGMSPSFREGLAALGMRYVLDVPAGFTVWPPEPERTTTAYQGRGRPANPGWWAGSGALWRSAATSCRRRLGVRSRWPMVARVPAATCSALRGCVQPAGVSPAGSTGPSAAGTWTAANPATTCPTLRRIPHWRPWHTWEAPGGALRPMEAGADAQDQDGDHREIGLKGAALAPIGRNSGKSVLPGCDLRPLTFTGPSRAADGVLSPVVQTWGPRFAQPVF